MDYPRELRDSPGDELVILLDNELITLNSAISPRSALIETAAEAIARTVDQPVEMRFVVRHTSSVPLSLGNKKIRKYTRKGAIFIQIFVRKGVGNLKIMDDVADFAGSLFEGRTIKLDPDPTDGRRIEFYARQNAENPLPLDQYFQTLVEVGFSYEDTRTVS